jgi:DNA-binding beta-propeller fold protein YncE
MGDSNCKHGASGAGGVCVECDIPQLARNNYFTGKLLVERDFTDEQRYLMGKQRRHNQRLHGWGAVCGLKVKPHPTCPDRYVIIEPGTAIDCCGREILVRAEEYFGFKDKFLENWQKQNGPNSQPDRATHKIQICVSYKECGTEDIPALFDDCNCDATSCQPNRVLESYGFDVLIDPKTTGTDGLNIDVNWSSTIGLANVVRVVANEATKRLFVLTSDSTANTATLYVIDAANDSILASQSLQSLLSPSFSNCTGLDVAVSPAGDFVYVALQPQPVTATSKPQPVILVLAISNLTTVVNTLGPFGSNGDAVRMGVAPAPDGRLLAVVPSQNNLLVWKTDINGPNPPKPKTPTTVTVGNNPGSIAVSDSGLYAYVANSGDGTVSVIPLATLTPVILPVGAGLSGSTPTVVAVASTIGGDTLAVLDTTITKAALYLISIPSSGPGFAVAIGSPVKAFTYSPIGVRLSPAGRWAYVLEQDSGTAKGGYIQVVDVNAVQINGPNLLGVPVSAGIQPTGETLSDDSTHLYVWYNGGGSIPGGVAILNVVQDGCCDLFKQTIEGCPDCTDGNCIVLATINTYIYGQPIGLPDIDNLTDRHLLISTDILTQAVQCLCEQGGGTGKPGKDGAPGPPGPGIDAVNAKFVPCDQAGSASITGASPNRTLNLTIPGECNKDLVGVSNVSWAPASGVLGRVIRSQLIKPGLKIAFTDVVQAADLTTDTVKLLIPVPALILTNPNNPPTSSDLVSYCEVPILVTPGNFKKLGDVTSVFTPTAVGNVNGVAFTLSSKNQKEIDIINFVVNATQKPFQVLVKGDFIRDAKQHGLDGDHLPPWVPKRPSGDGIEGGTFESWFQLEL